MFCVCRKGVRNPFFLPKAKLIITENSKKVIFNFCLSCAAEAVCAAQTWNVARGARLRRFRALTFQATVSGIERNYFLISALMSRIAFTTWYGNKRISRKIFPIIKRIFKIFTPFLDFFFIVLPPWIVIPPEIVLKQIISPLYYCFAKDIIAQECDRNMF